MPITNIGSINIDNTYVVDNFAAPGETLLVDKHLRGLGGKGANQSIALAAAGAQVRHIGAVGEDGAWTVSGLAEAGVDVSGIATLSTSTGHAVIQVDASGENSILVHSGANVALTEELIDRAIDGMSDRDWLLLQNETNHTEYIAKAGQEHGVRICYSAAPFIEDRVLPLLPLVDLIVVNELEAASLAAHFDGDEASIPVSGLIVTRGAEGATARIQHKTGELEAVSVSAFDVTAIDTTGAGDTFLGYFLASYDQGMSLQTSLHRASAAAAIQVTRPGAADAIPTGQEVTAFLEERS